MRNRKIDLLNPLCFPHLKKIDGFFEEIHKAWDSDDFQFFDKIIKGLREKCIELGKNDSLEMREIAVLNNVLRARISNNVADWRDAANAFYTLEHWFSYREILCTSPAEIEKGAKIVRKNAQMCDYFSTSF